MGSYKMKNIKELWDKFWDFRMYMRQYPIYCVFERALRIGLYGCVVTIGAQLAGGSEWSIPFLKVTLIAGLLAGFDKFRNALKEQPSYTSWLYRITNLGRKS